MQAVELTAGVIGVKRLRINYWIAVNGLCWEPCLSKTVVPSNNQLSTSSSCCISKLWPPVS